MRPGSTSPCPLLLLSLLHHQQTATVQAAVAADEVKSLPGWEGALPTKHYSGYLDANKGQHHMHYYLQLSEGDPKTDPITLWWGIYRVAT
jgi:serine carboxypeptidase-like clade 1